MASMRSKENYVKTFDRNIEGSSQRIAGIIDLFQDKQGYWVRKIEITKVSGQGLGFFIKKGNGFDRKNGVFISRVALGSILDINGLLHTGDEVLEVNRVNLKGFPLEDVALMMQIPDKLLLTTRSQIPVKISAKSLAKLSSKSPRTERDTAQNHFGRVYDNRHQEKEQLLLKSFSYSGATPNHIYSGGKYGRPSTPNQSGNKTRSKSSTTTTRQTKQADEEIMGQSVGSMYTITTNNNVDQKDSATRARFLPEVPAKAIKSPRILPSPPLTVNGSSTDDVKDDLSSVGQKEKKEAQTVPSGFKRAESYRVQPHEISDQCNEIPKLELTVLSDAEECSSRESPFLDITSNAQKDCYRAPSSTDTSKITSKLGFFRSYSAKEAKKELKHEPDRVYEPYKSDDLNSEMQFTRAFSGMLAVNIVKIEKLQNKSAKDKKCYCTIEIDDEFKASTSKKKTDSSSQCVQFEEQFDIEISLSSEMAIYVFSTGSGKQHSLLASGTIFLERILMKETSRCLALELESTGVIKICLDFTEVVKYLKRTPSSRKSGVFGFNIASTLDDEKNTIPTIVRKCVEEIEKRGMDIVGLYRISGNARKKKMLKAEFDQDSSLVDVSGKSGVDCNVLSGILKDYLRELPEPLIPKEAYSKIYQAKSNNSSPDLSTRQIMFSELLKLLPYGSRATMIYIMDHLIRVEENKEINKMDLTNLSVCFGPVLLCPPSTNEVLDFKKINDALEYLLKIWPKKHEQGVEIEITSM